MTIFPLHATVTNTSNILSVRFSESHNDASPICTIKALNTSLNIGDAVDVNLGYVGDTTEIISGYVKEISKSTSPTEYEITAYGAMVRAVDYFIASNNPEEPFTRQNISAEDLVKDIMALAGLTNYGYDATSFVFATQGPLEVNLVSAYDYCNMIAKTLAWHLYADSNGKVWFVDRKPYVDSGDSSSQTVYDVNIINGTYSIGERDLRNRIVVYGRAGIYAEAKQATSYNPITDSNEQILPSNFYKAVVASADWIDSQSMAQGAADYNLELLNRLQVEANLSIVGNATIKARDIITVDSEKLDLDHDFYVYTVDHSWDQRGFTTNLTLRM